MAEFTITGLRVVAAVAAAGSFTGAAASLGYTQSAISRQVAAMEAAAGTALFHRWARGVRPTPAGAVVTRHATGVLASLETAGHELAGLGDRLAGRLSIGVYPAAAAVLVPRALARLRREHPGLEVRIREASTPAQLRQLRAGRLAVAVIGAGADLEPYDLAGLRRHHVLDGSLRVAIAATHPFARRARVGAADLIDQWWIVGSGAPGDPQFGAWPTLRDPRIAHAVREWSTRFGMVAAGLGITVIPRLAAAAVPADVCTVAVDDPGWADRTTVAVTRTPASSGAEAVIGAVQTVASTLFDPPPIPSPDT